MTTTAQQHLADDVVRRLAAAIRASQLYSKGHSIIERNLEGLATVLDLVHKTQASVVMGVVDHELVVDDTPLQRSDSFGWLQRRLEELGVGRVTITRGVTAEELALFTHAVATLDTHTEGQVALPTLAHVSVGQIAIDERIEGSTADMAAFKRLYQDAVSMAGSVWNSALHESQPDPTVARTAIDGLAHAISQNKTALMALATLKNYDNYTFTHMVNVSILTMGQARALGIDGTLLREFGLAGLMHDIGKVRTPLEILNKPEKLTDAEFEIMKRHTVDGAEMLRATPDIPTLAPIVAFEHHLRRDGSGYPTGVSRPTLNLATIFCSIADVYDAMRSQRLYQEAFPTDRILAVLKRNDGTQFDQHLVRRFAQIIGIYPPGGLVRVDTGALAVVIKVHAPEPHRPHVRIVMDAAGVRVPIPYDVNLWEAVKGDGHPAAVVEPVDAATVDFDPLMVL